MNTMIINGREYKTRSFGFNEVCELEEVYGIGLEEFQKKPMPFLRAYIAMSTGLPKEVAGNEIEQHLIKGGKLEDMLSAIAKELEESGFFRALAQMQTTEITEASSEEISETTTKKTTRKIATR